MDFRELKGDTIYLSHPHSNHFPSHPLIEMSGKRVIDLTETEYVSPKNPKINKVAEAAINRMVVEEANKQLEMEQQKKDPELDPLLFIYFNSDVQETFKVVGDHPLLAGISGYHDRCEFMKEFTSEMHDEFIGDRTCESFISYFDGKGVEPSKGMKFRGVIDLGNDEEMEY